MIIWLLFSVLTVLAALAVLAPLARRRSAANEVGAEGGDGAASTVGDKPNAADMAIYKDQLAELERDVARGVLAPEEAEAARAEIARRLLKAARQAGAGGAVAASAGRRRLAAALVVVLLPAITLGVYLVNGSPQVSDAPLAARLAPDAPETQIRQLIARVEAHLAANPEDGRGWEVVAPVYLRLGRTADAVNAYRNAVRLLGPEPRLLADLGEAIINANGGLIPADARTVLEQAAEADPEAIKPRFYLAMALAQEGRRDEAIAAWQALLGKARGGEAWVEAARRQLAELGGEPPALPGPTQEQMAEAGDMPAGERQAMIADMVARLDARLAEGGGSVEEWQRLIRSYEVLGQAQAAAEARERARKALAGDPQALAQLEQPQMAAPALPGPSREQVEAAQEMSAEERQAMIAGMVARLDARLAAEGGSFEEWARLLQAYIVMGERDKAAETLRRARAGLADDASAQARLDDLAGQLGLD